MTEDSEKRYSRQVAVFELPVLLFLAIYFFAATFVDDIPVWAMWTVAGVGAAIIVLTLLRFLFLKYIRKQDDRLRMIRTGVKVGFEMILGAVVVFIATHLEGMDGATQTVILGGALLVVFVLICLAARPLLKR